MPPDRKSAKHKSVQRFGAVQLLMSFTNEELRRFKAFADSPYFNTSSKLKSLLHELAIHHPEFRSDKLTADKLFKSVFGKSRYNDVLLRKYMSELRSLAEEFLNVEEAVNDGNQRNTNILKRLANRSSSGLVIKFNSRLRSQGRKPEHKSYEDYLHLHLQDQIMLKLPVENSQLEESKQLLENSFDNLLRYFLFQYSFFVNEISSLGLMKTGKSNITSLDLMKENFDLNAFIDRLIEQGLTRDFYDGQFMKIILNDFQLEPGSSNGKPVEALMKLLAGNRKYENANMQHYLTYRLISYLYSCKLAGEKINERDLFELWKSLVEINERIQSDGVKLALSDFRGILMSAIRNGEHDWVKEFLHNCAGKIQDEGRENIINYGNAILAFHNGVFTDTLEFLNKISDASWVIRLDSYHLKAQVFYELGYYKSTLSVLDSFRHFLKSNRSFSREFIKMPISFVKALRMIVSLNSRYSVQKSEELYHELESDFQISKRDWLREKHQLLKQRHLEDSA